VRKTSIKKPYVRKTNASPIISFSSRFRIFLKNILVLSISIFLLLLMRTYNNGYKWTFENLLRYNLILLDEAKRLTEEQKREYTLGFSWKYLNFINENTPEDAIILMPPDTVFCPANTKSEFSPLIKIKAWASYFVYPRKLVYERERHTSPLYKWADYIAIVSYCGYSKVPYYVEKKVKNTVLPLRSKNPK
jgi:hypothetical protein